MTEQEALNALRKIEDDFQIAGKARIIAEFFEGLSIAEKALEKQIAKPPYFSGDGYWNGELVYDTWTCPNCEKDYEVDYEEHDYCPNCGQRIDWSKDAK